MDYTVAPDQYRAALNILTAGRILWTESISRDHQGFAWDVEAIGPNGYNEQAGGWTSTKLGARVKIIRHKRRMQRECRGQGS